MLKRRKRGSKHQGEIQFTFQYTLIPIDFAGIYALSHVLRQQKWSLRQSKKQSQGLKVTLWKGFLQDLGIDRNLDTTRVKGFLGSREKADNG